MIFTQSAAIFRLDKVQNSFMFLGDSIMEGVAIPFFFTLQPFDRSKKSCSQKQDIPLICMNCQII